MGLGLGLRKDENIIQVKEYPNRKHPDVANKGRHEFSKHPGRQGETEWKGSVLIMFTIITKPEKPVMFRANGDMKISFS